MARAGRDLGRHRYLKNYGYDTRLQYASPPYVQDITETPYRVSQWAEIQNPSGLPA